MTGGVREEARAKWRRRFVVKGVCGTRPEGEKGCGANCDNLWDNGGVIRAHDIRDSDFWAPDNSTLVDGDAHAVGPRRRDGRRTRIWMGRRLSIAPFGGGSTIVGAFRRRTSSRRGKVGSGGTSTERTGRCRSGQMRYRAGNKYGMDTLSREAKRRGGAAEKREATTGVLD